MVHQNEYSASISKIFFSPAKIQSKNNCYKHVGNQENHFNFSHFKKKAYNRITHWQNTKISPLLFYYFFLFGRRLFRKSDNFVGDFLLFLKYCQKIGENTSEINIYFVG